MNIESAAKLICQPSPEFRAAAQAPDGRIYIIYDHNRGDRRSTTADAEREILMAVFTERDIEAGRPVDPRTRLRVQVNRIPGGVS